MYFKFQYELTTFPLFQAYIGGKKSDNEVSGISNTEFSRYRCLKLLMSFKSWPLYPLSIGGDSCSERQKECFQRTRHNFGGDRGKQPSEEKAPFSD